MLKFDDFEGERVFLVECLPAREPIYVKDGDQKRFYVRTGASTSELNIDDAQKYISKRF